MKHFLAALQFLTILPFPAGRYNGLSELEGSLPWFLPLGFVTGALLALLDAGLRHIFPLPLASAIVIIALMLVSGCMHMDGLADTADGFFSSRPREEILRIMKDSRTGPMGVSAIVSVTILKIVALASVAAPLRWWAIMITPAAGYCAITLSIALLSYARSEGGLGGIFRNSRSVRHAFLAEGLLLVVGWLAGGAPGFLAGMFTIVVGLCFAVYSHRKIGGYTGDTLGAANEIATIVPALVAAAWNYAGGGL